MSDRVRFGILGAAKINDRVVPALHASNLGQAVAIASRDLDKSRAAARRLNIPRALGSYEHLLADPEIDAVYIPLPNHLHGEWTLKAADAGKHVLCEKPLALNAAEAQRLMDHCRARGVRLMDGFMWPHHARTARLRQLVNDGILGDVVRLTTCFSFPLPLDPANIRLNPQCGGGSLFDVGCYPVYLARWLFQAEPTRVFASGQFDFGVDLRLEAVLEFPGGRSALFDCAFTLPYRTQAEIVGTKASIQIPRMWLPLPEADFFIHYDDDRGERVVITGCDQIVCMIDEFCQAVRQGRDTRPGPEQAVGTMRVLDALLDSARRAAPVTL